MKRTELQKAQEKRQNKVDSHGNYIRIVRRTACWRMLASVR